MRSCLIDGEVVCCDDRGLAVFQALRRRQNEERAFLYAFDLLELNGDDLRREPIEVRKATLASILRKARHGVRLMPLKLRPTGLGSGIDKDRPDCTAAAGMLVASAVLRCASRSQGHELIRRLECQGQ